MLGGRNVPNCGSSQEATDNSLPHSEDAYLGGIVGIILVDSGSSVQSRKKGSFSRFLPVQNQTSALFEENDQEETKKIAEFEAQSQDTLGNTRIYWDT